ncbi:cytochrome C [Sphingomonas sp. S-NIH.Pt1_0416]|uniref:c-type cytochrome n=1 Tax=Sphingomonas sp. S-NIH.Pt1_0416 TaxID=1920123 RepID=UPI000F7E7BD0|nr:c-type cytochrome [Sphingomonas sp. S-NIH.Pt1_0416]RSU69015.1 cytochrome C [Sphingomonas sp. S-NIH.Pt1_0416]
MTIRITWKRVIVTLIGLFALGMAFAWSGVMNLAASSGHWAITDWFLHWAMRNSVKTHAAFTAPDDPSDAIGLVSAAGHFANSCAVCHGAPGQKPAPVMQAATPPAPDLAVNAREWTDKQLFWILQHGVKYTGMPAWAVQDRQDEVRRMVAFVRRLPDMTPAQYRALVAEGSPATDPDNCTGCHGTDGRGRGSPDIPVLGGQNPAYLLAALQGYANGTRSSAVMQQVAMRMEPAEMAAAVRRFAAMPGLGARPNGSAEAARIVERGLPEKQLPACVSCHAPGKPYPVLAGQRATYIAERLRHWQGDKNVVDARKSHATMPVIARRIPKDMIDPIARYLAGDGAAPPRS